MKKKCRLNVDKWMTNATSTYPLKASLRKIHGLSIEDFTENKDTLNRLLTAYRYQIGMTTKA
jgi:hypothetical protein